MMIVVPLLPGQSRDKVRVGDEMMEYDWLGPNVIVGVLSDEDEVKEKEGVDGVDPTSDS